MAKPLYRALPSVSLASVCTSSTSLSSEIWTALSLVLPVSTVQGCSICKSRVAPAGHVRSLLLLGDLGDLVRLLVGLVDIGRREPVPHRWSRPEGPVGGWPVAYLRPREAATARNSSGALSTRRSSSRKPPSSIVRSTSASLSGLTRLLPVLGLGAGEASLRCSVKMVRGRGAMTEDRCSRIVQRLGDEP